MTARNIEFLRLLIFFIFGLSATYTPSLAQQTLEVSIAHPDDDAEEAGPDGERPGYMNLRSTDLSLVYDGPRGGHQVVGLRFRNLNLSPGVRIVRAYLQFACDETIGSPGTKFIAIQDSDDAPAFSIWNGDLSSRATLPDAVSWSGIPIWDRSGAIGMAQRTPDLSGLLQAIVDRPGWQAGQAVAFLIRGSGQRVADSYEGDPELAPRLIVEYLDGTYSVGDFPVRRQSVWRYHDRGQDLGIDWTRPHYDDSGWAMGVGKMGYGEGDERTRLDFGSNPNRKHPTYYFRHSFEVAPHQAADSLILRALVDDGMRVFLDGQEILRRNLPAGNVHFRTLANQRVTGADERRYLAAHVAADLLPGRHVLAVEVHLHSRTSEDLAFDLELVSAQRALAPATLPIARGSAWAYRDSLVDLDGSGWAMPGYDASDWAYGSGPLGYGRSGLKTPLTYGPDPRTKPMTAYFRREVFVPDFAELPDSLELHLLRDDGAVVYVNGQELWRSNMPGGELNAQSPASSENEANQRYVTQNVSTHAFRVGINVIGVEVHQHSAQGEDLFFDLEVKKLLRAHFEADQQEVPEGTRIQFSAVTRPRPDSVWWSFPGAEPRQSTERDPAVVYPEMGQYDVQLVVALDGERDTLHRRAYVMVNGTTGFAEEASATQVKAYPNPMVGADLHLDFHLERAQTVQVELWTLDGRRVETLAQRRLLAGPQSLRLRPHPFSGPRLLRVQVGAQQHSQVIYAQR